MSCNLIYIYGGDCHDDGNDEENDFKPFINHTVYADSTEVLLFEQGSKILPMMLMVVVMLVFGHDTYSFLTAK